MAGGSTVAGGPGDTGALPTEAEGNYIANAGEIVSTNGMTYVAFDSNISSFVKADGTLARTEWIPTNNGWYHANESGALDAGWKNIDNKWYYFDTSATNSKYVMKTGFIVDTYAGSSNLYYLTNNGDMVTGYQLINGNLYYFNTTNSATSPIGAMAVNRVTPDGRMADATGIVR